MFIMYLFWGLTNVTPHTGSVTRFGYGTELEEPEKRVFCVGMKFNSWRVAVNVLI